MMITAKPTGYPGPRWDEPGWITRITDRPEGCVAVTVEPVPGAPEAGGGRPPGVLGGRTVVVAVLVAVLAGGAAGAAIQAALIGAGERDGDWAAVGATRTVTLADDQAVDLDAGVVGGEAVLGGDVALTHRGNRLTARAPAQVAVLDAGGEPDPGRCAAAAPDRWEDGLDGLDDLARGSDLCVTTSARRSAVLTLEQPPDSVSASMTFRYTLWERRR
jgi:hypothetical protein